MKSGKKAVFLFFFIALLASGLCLGTCSRGTEAPGKSYVALITKSMDSAFWQSVYAGAGAAATEYNLEITLEGPASEEDYETQNMLIDRAVENGAKVIIFSAVDYNANSEAINRAAKSGVKIVVIDSDVNSSQVSCRIGTDNHAAGRMAGRAVLDTEEEELYIGIVNHDVNSANGQQREEGFREAALEDERVKAMYTINVPSTTEDAREGAANLLKEHPEINAVVTFNEWTSLGVGWAIRDMELADSTRVVAFDSNVVSVGMLETGEVDALIVQNPYAMGYLGVERANSLITGSGQEESRIDTATTCVTRENMFEPECQRILFAF
ncbi:MAG: substrate-binding domain-containing protein [Kineothrix sp.]